MSNAVHRSRELQLCDKCGEQIEIGEDYYIDELGTIVCSDCRQEDASEIELLLAEGY